MLYLGYHAIETRVALILGRLDSHDGVSEVVEGNTNAGNREEGVVGVDNELGTRVLKKKKKVSIESKSGEKRN